MTRDTFGFPRQCGAQPIEVQIFAVEAAAVAVVVVVVVAEVVAGERLGTGIEVEVMVEFIHRPAELATWKYSRVNKYLAMAYEISTLSTHGIYLFTSFSLILTLTASRNILLFLVHMHDVVYAKMLTI